ncbi:putative DNA methylase [Bacillus phage BSP18]|nr:putative DNA methylase [Bacillus phage BSP18]
MGKELLGSLELNRIYQMNCLEGMKLIPDNSVHSIVTDPPYELGFMGKSWDSTGIAYNVDLWKECLRVLKPGGYLLAFGGTRTYHRMTCAIEDAGFEIRDQIQWIYGQGFPKSHNISKAIDKKLGVKREVVGKHTHPTAKNGNRTGSKPPYQAEDSPLDGSYKITTPATDLAKQWDGWGTALKPANEPIVMARKPLSEKSVSENVMKWGTGGINIDDCRIEFAENDDSRIGKDYKHSAKAGLENGNKKDNSSGQPQQLHNPKGRFPANVIFDEESSKALDEQSGILKSGTNAVRRKEGFFVEHGGLGKAGDIQITYGDSGGASRFFYCAKAKKKEKGEGNNHPTVKPIKLMEYLVKMVTPPNGFVIDPFTGSGTTLIASKLNDMQYIGFELESEYIEIANMRLDCIEDYK